MNRLQLFFKGVCMLALSCQRGRGSAAIAECARGSGGGQCLALTQLRVGAVSRERCLQSVMRSLKFTLQRIRMLAFSRQ
jgi:hypothetical protein